MDRRTPLPVGTQLRFTNREGGAVLYTVGREIGRGGSCIVYDGSYETNAGIRKTVRIRECFPWRLNMSRLPSGTVSAAPDATEDFQAARSRFWQDFHTGILLFQEGGLSDTLVNSLDIYEANGTVYAVFVYSPENTLAARQPDTLKSCLSLMALTARALDRLHRAGYLYLDLKPDNVLMVPGPPERIQLFDLDSLIPLKELRSGLQSPIGVRLSCSSGYAPLELRRGLWKKLGPHTDVYTLGALLFRLLFGHTPAAPDCDPSASFAFETSRFDPSLYPDRLFSGLTDLFHRTLADYIPDRCPDMGPVIQALEELIPLADPVIPYVRGSTLLPPPVLIGRERELSALNAWLDNENGSVLLVTGMGGIGKSTLVRRFVVDRTRDLDTILFLQYRDSIQETLCDDSQLFIRTVQRQSEETTEQYAQRKMRYLRRLLAGTRSLVVLDGYEAMIQEELTDLFSAVWKTIVVSRRQPVSCGYEILRIDALETQAFRRALMEAYLGRRLEPAEIPAADRIIRCAAGHTLAIELVARQINSSYLSLKEAADLAERYGVTNIAPEKVGYVQDQVEHYDTVVALIDALFDAGKLRREKRNLLRILALFGTTGIEIRTFQELLALSTKDPLRELVRDGWIRSDDSVLSLHPLIQEAVRRWGWHRDTRKAALHVMSALSDRLRQEHPTEDSPAPFSPSMQNLLRLCEAVLDGYAEDSSLSRAEASVELLYRTVMALPPEREDTILEKSAILLKARIFSDVIRRLNVYDRIALIQEERGNFPEAWKTIREAKRLLHIGSGSEAWGYYYDLESTYYDNILDGHYDAEIPEYAHYLKELIKASNRTCQCLKGAKHPNAKLLRIQNLISYAIVLTRSAPKNPKPIHNLLTTAREDMARYGRTDNLTRSLYQMAMSWYHTYAVPDFNQVQTSLETARTLLARASPSVLEEIDQILVPTANILLEWERYDETVYWLEESVTLCDRFPDIIPYVRRKMDLLSHLLDTWIQIGNSKQIRAMIQRIDEENRKNRALGIELEIPMRLRAQYATV